MLELVLNDELSTTYSFKGEGYEFVKSILKEGFSPVETFNISFFQGHQVIVYEKVKNGNCKYYVANIPNKINQNNKYYITFYKEDNLTKTLEFYTKLENGSITL